MNSNKNKNTRPQFLKRQLVCPTDRTAGTQHDWREHHPRSPKGPWTPKVQSFGLDPKKLASKILFFVFETMSLPSGTARIVVAIADHLRNKRSQSISTSGASTVIQEERAKARLPQHAFKDFRYQALHVVDLGVSCSLRTLSFATCQMITSTLFEPSPPTSQANTTWRTHPCAPVNSEHGSALRLLLCTTAFRLNLRTLAACSSFTLNCGPKCRKGFSCGC